MDVLPHSTLLAPPRPLRYYENANIPFPSEGEGGGRVEISRRLLGYLDTRLRVVGGFCPPPPSCYLENRRSVMHGRDNV